MNHFQYEIILDDFHKELWIFYVDSDIKFYLDKYYYYERKSKRHGWQSINNYSRIDSRYSNMTLEDVRRVFSQEIIERTKKLFLEQMTVTLWEKK